MAPPVGITLSLRHVPLKFLERRNIRRPAKESIDIGVARESVQQRTHGNVDPDDTPLPIPVWRDIIDRQRGHSERPFRIRCLK